MRTETKQLISVGLGGVAFGTIASLFAATAYIYHGSPPSTAIAAAAQGLIASFGLLVGPFLGPVIRSRAKAGSTPSNG